MEPFNVNSPVQKISVSSFAQRDYYLPAYGRPLAAGTYDFEGLGYGRSRRIVALAAGNLSAITYAALDSTGTRITIAGAIAAPAGFVHDTAGVVAITCSMAIVAYFD